jgi:hypothetical protein
MKRDELIKLLLTYDNLEVKIYANSTTYDILETDIFHCSTHQCPDTIFIQPVEPYEKR